MRCPDVSLKRNALRIARVRYGSTLWRRPRLVIIRGRRSASRREAGQGEAGRVKAAPGQPSGSTTREVQCTKPGLEMGVAEDTQDPEFARALLLAAVDEGVP